MNEVAYEIALLSLGNLLDKLRHRDDIPESSEVGQIVMNAEKFFQIINGNISPILDELRELRYENAKLLGEYNDTIPNFDEVLSLYRKIHESGGDAQLICKVAIANELDGIIVIKVLRTLFNLSLHEAKEIYDKFS